MCTKDGTSTYDKAVLEGQLPDEICEELEDGEWSKTYTDVDELFRDLGLYDE